MAAAARAASGHYSGSCRLADGCDRRRRGNQRGVARRLDQQSDDLHFLGDGDRRRSRCGSVHRTKTEGGRLQRGPAAHRAARRGVDLLRGAAVPLPHADFDRNVRPYRARRHGGDEHLLFICDGIHSGHRALQRRRGAVPHDGPQRRVAQSFTPDEQYQRDRQRRFDLWLRYGRRGRRDPDARVPHGRGSRHPLAALQPQSDAAPF